jgi:signal transduction histidine kinase
MGSVNEATTGERTGTSRWLAIALNGVFLSLVVLSVLRIRTTGAVIAGIAIGAWYLVGVALRSRRDTNLVALWLGVLTALWVAASFAVASDFVWLAFPLFFLYLFLLPVNVGLGAVVGATAVAIGALSTDGMLEMGEVIGPIVGAVVATISAFSYRGLSEEHERTRRLLTELEATRGKLADVERERGALEERRRVAREVHDTIAQGLSSIILLARAIELNPEDETDRVSQIAEIAQTNLDDARRIVAALSPAELDNDPLPDAIESVVTRVSETSAVKAWFVCTGELTRLPLDLEVALLRVAQGALANVAAHSGATRAEVVLTYEDDATTLVIADDGRGFDPATMARSAEGSFGLFVMDDRMAAVGGTLAIDTDIGNGTIVTAKIPLRHP